MCGLHRRHVLRHARQHGDLRRGVAHRIETGRHLRVVAREAERDVEVLQAVEDLVQARGADRAAIGRLLGERDGLLRHRVGELLGLLRFVQHRRVVRPEAEHADRAVDAIDLGARHARAGVRVDQRRGGLVHGIVRAGEALQRRAGVDVLLQQRQVVGDAVQLGARRCGLQRLGRAVAVLPRVDGVDHRAVGRPARDERRLLQVAGQRLLAAGGDRAQRPEAVAIGGVGGDVDRHATVEHHVEVFARAGDLFDVHDAATAAGVGDARPQRRHDRREVLRVEVRRGRSVAADVHGADSCEVGVELLELDFIGRRFFSKRPFAHDRVSGDRRAGVRILSGRQDDVEVDVRVAARLRADHDRVALDPEGAEHRHLQDGLVVAVASLGIERGLFRVAQRLLIQRAAVGRVADRILHVADLVAHPGVDGLGHSVVVLVGDLRGIHEVDRQGADLGGARAPLPLGHLRHHLHGGVDAGHTLGEPTALHVDVAGGKMHGHSVSVISDKGMGISWRSR